MFIWAIEQGWQKHVTCDNNVRKLVAIGVGEAKTHRTVSAEVAFDVEGLAQLLAPEHHWDALHATGYGGQEEQPAVWVAGVKSVLVVAREDREALGRATVEAGSAEPCSHLVEDSLDAIENRSRCTYAVLAVPTTDTVAEVVLPIRLSRHDVGGWWCL